jgi:hypothetical protein
MGDVNKYIKVIHYAGPGKTINGLWRYNKKHVLRLG